ERRDHALFVAFAPYETPRFAISVIVEHGGGGSKAAAPNARDILLAARDLTAPADDVPSGQGRNQPMPQARTKDRA
ncbi:MAG: penicillin-binding transpeptidase domain-containing protein, partial [Sphingomonadaceae bacterium]